MNEYKGHASISTNEYRVAGRNLDLVIGKNTISTNTEDLPNSKEYRESIENTFRYSIYNGWSEPKYQCPKCDGGMCRNEIIVLAGYPETYEYRCNKCGHVEYQYG